jgi:hypothetical protein
MSPTDGEIHHHHHKTGAACMVAAMRVVLAIVVVFHTAMLSNGFIVSSKIQKSCSSLQMTCNRRRILEASLRTTAAAAVYVLFDSATKRPAVAAYGESASMQGFDYIEFLIEKNAVADPSTFLYQGADREVQLKRISDAVKNLQKIPVAATERKWSQVQGTLTGPLGTLGATMNAVATTKEARAASQKVKADLYAVGDAAAKKNEAGCLRATEEALKDLKAFVEVAF